jgi:predicted choloylglycine hydrolase
MTENQDGVGRGPAPPGGQGWQRWTEGVDWSDWRSWLQRLAATDWTATDWAAVDWAAVDWTGTDWTGTDRTPTERAPVDWTRQQAPGTPWEEAPWGREIPLTLRAFAEDEPGDQIREHLAATWPPFRQWWRGGANTRPTTGEARAKLEEHMPELIPAWQQLTAMLEHGPDGSDAGAALALWNPPPFLTGCSQAAVLPGGPALIRNYDWDYRLFDGVVASTAYTGRRVLGMLDCLWGLLDGVNDAGLAVSLTFGGRPQVGEGFGIPLVIRYVLEVCGTVEEAVRVLRQVPVHMSYNVTALDRDGRRATVYLAPDRPARVTDLAVSTNHQGEVEWAPYVAAIRSVERQDYLEELLAAGADAPGVVAACLRPPLYATRFHEGFGTLYTAEYRPADGLVRYHWPDRTWEHSLDRIDPTGVQVQLGSPAPAPQP